MKKRVLIPVLIIIFIPMNFIASLGVDSTFRPTFDLFNTNNSAPVDRIYRNNAVQTILSEYANIQNMVNDKIYFEFHLGFGENYLMDKTILDYGNHQYYGSSQYYWGDNWTNYLTFNGSILFKFNLFNPKRPYAERALTKINYIYELAAQYSITLTEDAKNKLNQIKKEFGNYNNEFWFKRISLGIGIPFETELYSYSSGNYIANFANNLFHVEDIYLFVGYDIGDFLTIEVGPNISMNRLFFGFSFDMSTPVYVLSGYFFNALKQLFGLPSATMSPINIIY